MAQKIAKLGIERDDSNFLYYINKDGDVWQVARKQAGMKKGKPSRVAQTDVVKEAGYLYFLDKNGDVSRAKLRWEDRSARRRSSCRRRWR